jgi:hypothetical protein
VVRKILNEGHNGEEKVYLVDWGGRWKPTWQPWSDIKDTANEALADYRRRMQPAAVAGGKKPPAKKKKK